MTEPVHESPLSLTDRSAPRAAPSDAACAAPPLHAAGQMHQGSAAALLGSGPQNYQYDNCSISTWFLYLHAGLRPGVWRAAGEACSAAAAGDYHRQGSASRRVWGGGRGTTFCYLCLVDTCDFVCYCGLTTARFKALPRGEFGEEDVERGF